MSLWCSTNFVNKTLLRRSFSCINSADYKREDLVYQHFVLNITIGILKKIFSAISIDFSL